MTDRYASLKQGLVGCWIPSISGSGLLLPDLSGRNNNGSLVGMDASDWVSGQYGRALDFDGVNDYVACGNPEIQNTASFSVSCWARTTTLSPVGQRIFGRESPTGNFSGLALAFFRRATLDSSSVTLFIGNPSSGVIDVNAGANVVAVNTWYHIAATYDGSTQASGVQIAINGELKTTTIAINTFSTPATISNPAAIGVRGDATGGGFLSGIVDDVRAYSRVLTLSEIRLLASEPGIGFKRISSSAFATRYAYKPAKPRNYSVIRNRDPNYSTLRQGLVAAYCPSISGQGNVLPDLVGGNHGTLTNMDASDWVSSGDGRALDFDGTDDRVDISNESNFDFERTAQFSVTFWARLNTLSPTAQVVASKLDPVAQNTGWEVRFFSPFPGVDSNAINFILANNVSGGNFLMCTAAVGSLAVNQWLHIGVTYNGSSTASGVNLFLSGQRLSVTVNTDALTASILNDLQVRIGQRANSSNTFPLNGQLDDIRIYNRALSEPEIKLLASKRGIGLEPRKPKITFADLGVQKTYSVVRVKETDYATLRQGLVGAWCPSLPNGGSGNTLPDVSGRGNHGTLTNMGPEDWVSGQYGRALDFDGSNDHILVSHQPFASLQQGTITGWVNTSNDVNQCLFALANTSNSNQFAFFGYGGDQTGTLTNELIYFIIRGFAGTDLATFGYTTSNRTELIDGRWHHIAIAVNGTSASSIYLDGVSRSISVSNQYPTSNEGQFFGDLTGLNKCLIAAYQIGVDLGGYASGRQDDIRIYNRALSPNEIRLLASRPGIGLRQESHRNTFYQFPSFQPALARRSSAIIGGGIT